MLFQCLRSAYQFFAHYFFSSQNRHTAAVITIIITFCWKSPRCRCGLTCSLPLLHTELVSARKIARLEKEKLSSWEWSCEVCTLQVRTCLAFYPFSNHKLRRWDALRDHHFLWLSPSLPPIALLQVLVRTVRPACNDGRWCLGHLTLLSLDVRPRSASPIIQTTLYSSRPRRLVCGLSFTSSGLDIRKK